eukprot:TRINITY_DN11871_c0_g1_i3.p1 TRINITY_DN11871_c0_g1~~TRINITY_DN11871_c0_g1_i3.p1  ORF type:complete len:404 (-),score=71.70 TRINITY_DN11871_c0_g1_i3:212-1423(-)
MLASKTEEPAGLSDLEQELVQWSEWPAELFEDRERQPRVVRTAEEFRRALLLEDFIDKVVVLPNGISLLGLEETVALPAWLPKAVDRAPTVLDFLRRIESDALSTHKAALEYVDEWGEQREALPRPYPYCLWDEQALGLPAACDVKSTATPQPASAVGQTEALPEAWRDLRQRLAAVEGLVRRGEIEAERLYCCELRLLRERPANSGAATCAVAEASTKSLCRRHARDYFQENACFSLYWNCYDDGVFVGGRGSGKGLHVDQVLWSNVGKQWRGHKLLAIWPPGEVSSRMVSELCDSHFKPPLGARQRAALEQASQIILLRPGDVFLMSGGVAHATVTVSQDLTLTGYESLVTLHPRHVAHFLCTGASSGPCAMERGVMQCDELRDFFQGVAKRVLSVWSSPA